MKRAAFVMSCIGAMQGILLLAITSILSKLTPVFARIVFMTQTSGSFAPEDYTVTFIFADILAVILIAVCLFCAVKIYRSEK